MFEITSTILLNRNNITTAADKFGYSRKADPNIPKQSCTAGQTLVEGDISRIFDDTQLFAYQKCPTKAQPQNKTEDHDEHTTD